MKDDRLAENSAEAFKMWHLAVKVLLEEFRRKRLGPPPVLRRPSSASQLSRAVINSNDTDFTF